MKILHIADTHLGYSAYRKVNPDGINQREIDVYDAFKQFVDYAIKSKPDLIIHAGDLFDSVRPNNRAITFALTQILRLSKEKIPLIVIAGNHEHPKLKETGHIFSIFEHIEHVYPIFKSKLETLHFSLNEKKITIQILPQCELKQQFNDELKNVKPDPKADYNIFVSHGAVAGIKAFSMNEFNELMIPVKFLSEDFDYIALGHYHTYTKLAKNAFYSGSTEYFTFTDSKHKKGFIEIEFKDGKFKQSFIELKIRHMVDPEPIYCKDLKLEEVMKKIKESIKQIDPKEKILRITLDEIPSHIYRGIDFREIKKLSTDAIHYELKANVIKEGISKTTETSKIASLTTEFKQFIENQDIKEKEKFLKLGMDYIEKIEEREKNK